MEKITKIIKASAGSGKTYTLVLEYLLLAFNEKLAFSEILATTFTKKAARQIKDRILASLNDLASGNIGNIGQTIKKIKQWDDITLVSKSQALFKEILENYSLFNIATIDSFFQQIIATCRGTQNIPTNLTIELESSNIIKNITTSVLELAKNDASLCHCITQNSLDNLLEGKRWEPFYCLENFCKKIFYKLSNDVQVHEGDCLLRFISENIELYETKLQEFAQEAFSKLGEIDFNDFAFGQRGVIGYLLKLTQRQIATPSLRVLKASKGAEFWLTKAKADNAELKMTINEILLPALNNILATHNENSKNYKTYLEIKKLLMLASLYNTIKLQFIEEKKKRNVITINDFPKTVYNIFANHRLETIFQKLGILPKYIFIDEFQDISIEQWRCFAIILSNYNPNQTNYLIGDVKQSIYRWRNSKWTLLNSEVEDELQNTKTIFLKNNWRSAHNIVLFNNSLFSNIIKLVCLEIQNRIQTIEDQLIIDHYSAKICELQNVYKDIYQIPQQANNEGYIKIEFIEGGDEIEKTLETVSLLKKLGHHDICIIVRNHKEGRSINTALLNANQGYEINSIYSLALSTSSYVSLLIAAMHYLVYKDSLSLLNMYYLVLVINKHSEPELVFHQNDLIEKDKILRLQNLECYNVSSLPLLVLAIFDLDPNEELCFIEKFIDICIDFEKKNNSLVAFLNWWQQSGKNTTIESSETLEAIKILTIHQSKGLEFDNVVIPFCDSSLEHQSTLAPTLWCDYAYNTNSARQLPVPYSSKLLNTHFAKDFIDEQINYYLDNINLFYVANTRAKKNLYLFSSLKNSSRKDQEPKFAIAKLLFDAILSNDNTPSTHIDSNQTFVSLSHFFDQEKNIFEIGKLTINAEDQKQESNNFDLKMIWKKSSKFSLSYNTSKLKSAKQKLGINIHKILSSIKYLDDLEFEIQNNTNKHDKYVCDILNLLKNQKTINKYFNSSFTHLSEWPMFCKKNKTILKPDRVLLSLKNAIVLEFKTGEKKQKHIMQTKNYMTALRDLGYNTPEAYILYLQTDHIEEVVVNV